MLIQPEFIKLVNSVLIVTAQELENQHFLFLIGFADDQKLKRSKSMLPSGTISIKNNQDVEKKSP